MAQADFYEVVTRVYSERYFRALFWRDQAVVLRDYELTPDELELLAHLEPSAVERVATTLSAKWEDLFKSTYQIAFRFAPFVATRAVRKYTEVPRQRQGERATAVVEDFGKYLYYQLSAERGVAPWLAPATRFECLLYQVSHCTTGFRSGIASSRRSDFSYVTDMVIRRPGVVVANFDFDVAAVLRQCADEDVQQCSLFVSPEEAWYVIVPTHFKSSPTVLSVSASMATMVSLCGRPVRISYAMAGVEVHSNEDAVVRAVSRLADVGAVERVRE